MTDLTKIREALLHAARTFREYETLHAAKPDMVKAERNAKHAVICESAIAHLDAIENAPIPKDERYKRGYDDGYDAAKAEHQPTDTVVDLEAGARAIQRELRRWDGMDSLLLMAKACAEAWGLNTRSPCARPQSDNELFTSQPVGWSPVRDDRLIALLEKISCLGNGEIPGDSIGNTMAQQALEMAKNPPYATIELESVDGAELARLQKIDWCVKKNRIDLTSKEWRPMYTAPKDAVILVIWDNKVMPAKYLDNSEKDKPWEGWKPVGMQPWPAGAPDCWQPMPKPPLSSIEGEAP